MATGYRPVDRDQPFLFPPDTRSANVAASAGTVGNRQVKRNQSLRQPRYRGAGPALSRDPPAHGPEFRDLTGPVGY